MTHTSKLRRDDGGIAVFTAVCVIALLAIIGLVLDGGGKLRATERADSLALEAARAGGQALDPGAAVPGTAIRVDPQAATAAAHAYLHRAGVSGQVSMSDGGTTLTVTVADTYETKFLPVVGIGSMPVTGKASATLLHGVDQPE
ncbi:pilus assembly protein TadG-related protein (plasmid) [Streptomyces sp. NBC_01724]|uniref:pilus assembly protein TadG-related protein n=1 Tax=unclassified Streptomyces TaxID=2593676 RepID=UPI002E328C3F|nr:pilus assembly protein TadG-related protein [Streptomyces sp. NBC_01724]